MTARIHIVFAATEAEVKELEALGWSLNAERPMRRPFAGAAMIWTRREPPALPERAARVSPAGGST